MTSWARVIAGAAVDPVSLVAGCSALFDNAGAIAAFRVLTARADSSNLLSRMPTEIVDRVVDFTMGRAIASARRRVKALVGDVETIDSRPVLHSRPVAR